MMNETFVENLYLLSLGGALICFIAAGATCLCDFAEKLWP
jgi:hypothetical protein